MSKTNNYSYCSALRFVSLILLITLPILGFYLGVKYQVTKSQEIENLSANWNIYTNTKYGYSFKYPGELELGLGNISQWSSKAYGSNAGGVLLSGNKSPEPVIFEDLAAVHLINSGNGELIDIRAINYFAPLINYQDWSLKQININGNQVESYVNKNLPIVIYRFKNEIKQIQVDFLTTILNKTAEPSDNFLNILSTFKFTQ